MQMLHGLVPYVPRCDSPGGMRYHPSYSAAFLQGALALLPKARRRDGNGVVATKGAVLADRAGMDRVRFSAICRGICIASLEELYKIRNVLPPQALVPVAALDAWFAADSQTRAVWREEGRKIGQIRGNATVNRRYVARVEPPPPTREETVEVLEAMYTARDEHMAALADLNNMCASLAGAEWSIRELRKQKEALVSEVAALRGRLQDAQAMPPPFTSVTDGFTRGFPLFAKLGSADQARVIAALAGALGLLSKGDAP